MGDIPQNVTPRSYIDVTNHDPQTAYVRISKTLGEGQDQYFAIATDETERWRRHIGRRVTIKLAHSAHGPVVQSVDHTTELSSHNNDFQVNGGRLQINGPNGPIDL